MSWEIKYHQALDDLRAATYDTTVDALVAELPYLWLDRYTTMCDGQVNVLRITVLDLEYLFDFCTEIGAPREDRVVVAFGRSRPGDVSRPSSRIAGFPGSDDRGDRGHFIAHSGGGGVDINLFHQDQQVNRGWSVEGKEFRRMERYYADHPGTFCFSRPAYKDATARPSLLEVGILRRDLTFWIASFSNDPAG